jgi:hypothetical protein
MNKHIGSFEVPAASFQSIDELMLLALLSLCQMLRKCTRMASNGSVVFIEFASLYQPVRLAGG